MPIAPAGQVVCGMQLPVQALPRSFREPWELDAGVEELVAVAQAADAAGFAYVSACDHVAIPGGAAAEQLSTTWYDTVATLGFLAAATSQVRLVAGVYVPALRHPLLTAKAFATLDRLSGGRVVIGVGAGHLEAEFAALGADFPGRGDATDEAIDAVRAAWDQELATFHGERWSWDDLAVSPRPVQERIPIWIGGRGRPALRRVAERGDGWLPQATPRADMAGEIAYVEEHRKRVRPDAVLDLGWLPEWLYVGTPTWDLGDHAHVTGSPEELAASLRYAHELGVTHLSVKLRSRGVDELVDQLAAFGRDVIPLLNP
jgi:probable F420-dependent oxidoreductase